MTGKSSSMVCRPKKTGQHAFEPVTQRPSLPHRPNRNTIKLVGHACFVAKMAVAQICIGRWQKHTLKSARARWCAAASILTTAARYVSKTCLLHCHISQLHLMYMMYRKYWEVPDYTKKVLLLHHSLGSTLHCCGHIVLQSHFVIVSQQQPRCDVAWVAAHLLDTHARDVWMCVKQQAPDSSR